jgi:hypothetical protein
VLPPLSLLRAQLEQTILDKAEQGHEVAGLRDELDHLPPSYDRLWAFGQRLAELPLRSDWPYVEPNELTSIWAECDPARPLGTLCGCVLGKPLELHVSMADIRPALEQTGAWPLREYVSIHLREVLGRLKESYDSPLDQTTREHLRASHRPTTISTTWSWAC